MEVIDELDLVDVREDKVSHGASLRLREGERSRECLRAGVFFAAKVSVGETIVAIEVDTSVGVVSAEPFSTPAIVSVLALHHVVSCLEECLLDVKDAIDIEDGDYVEGDVLKQINVVLIVVDNSVQELEDDVEGHLDGDGFAGVMGTSNEHRRSLLGRLSPRLKLDQGDVATFVRLSKAGDFDVLRELFSELFDDNKGVVVGVMVTEAWDEQLVLDFVAEFGTVLHLLCQGLLPRDMFLSVSVPLHLHDQLFDLCQVAVGMCSSTKECDAGGQLGYIRQHLLYLYCV